MDYVKNILILALVAINVFFLAFIGLGIYRDNAVDKQMYRELYDLMERNGILLDTESIQTDGEMYRLDTSRDAVKEQELAEALLGETVAVDQGAGGIITTYIGENGEAVFRTGGEFKIVFTKDVFKAGDDIESTTEKILKTMSIETANVEISVTDENLTATAVCFWSDKEIFNCRVRFVYENGSLLEINGKHATNIRQTTEKTEMSASSAATALMSFLHSVKDGKYTCTAIMEVCPGYCYTAAVYGDGSLRPVWRIKANSGVYLVDAETGNVEPLIE